MDTNVGNIQCQHDENWQEDIPWITTNRKPELTKMIDSGFKRRNRQPLRRDGVPSVIHPIHGGAEKCSEERSNHCRYIRR